MFELGPAIVLSGVALLLGGINWFFSWLDKIVERDIKRWAEADVKARTIHYYLQVLLALLSEGNLSGAKSILNNLPMAENDQLPITRDEVLNHPDLKGTPLDPDSIYNRGNTKCS